MPVIVSGALHVPRLCTTAMSAAAISSVVLGQVHWLSALLPRGEEDRGAGHAVQLPPVTLL